MEDAAIIELFWSRAEDAIAQAQTKYGGYCKSIAFSILRSNEDAEECENDTFFKAWNSMPPHHPLALSSFLGKITRNLSIDRLRQKNSQKRRGEYLIVLDEIGECLASPESPEEEVDAELLAFYISQYLRVASKKERMLFVGRYWNLLSISELAEKFGCTESSVKVSLHRTRKDLAKYLRKEGYII